MSIACNHTHVSKCDIALGQYRTCIHMVQNGIIYVPGKHSASFFMLCVPDPGCTCDVDSSPKIEVIEHI